MRLGIGAVLGFSLVFSSLGCEEAVDLAAERDALLQVDRDFAAMSEAQGAVAAYYHFSAENVILLPPGREVREGREVIYQEDSAEGFPGQLTWIPEDADVSGSGDLGWSWGWWIYTLESADGNDIDRRGKYLFLWEKESGEWKVKINIWNDPPPTENDG